MKDYDTALELNPNDADIYHNRGVLKYVMGEREGAISDYNAAIKLDPKNANLYNNR